MEEAVKEKPKFSGKRLLITILIVLLTAGSVGGGTWYFMDQNVKKTKEANDKEIESLQKQIDDLKKESTTSDGAATPTATDETAGWKTYTSTKYGFSLKYPSSWTVNDTNPSISNNVAAPIPTIIFKDNAQEDFRIYILSNYGGWGMEGVKVAIRYDSRVSNKRISLSGRKFSETEEDIVAGGNAGYWIHANFIFNNLNYIFNATGSDKTKWQSGDTLFQKIIGTVRYN